MSDPVGATLYANAAETSFGYTPRVMKYVIPKALECITTQPLKVRWASGVEVTEKYRICRSVGKRQQVVFQRPSVPGADIDANFAIQILQQQAAAQQAADQVPYYQPPAPHNCYSYFVGKQMFTNCY